MGFTWHGAACRDVARPACGVVQGGDRADTGRLPDLLARGVPIKQVTEGVDMTAPSALLRAFVRKGGMAPGAGGTVDLTQRVYSVGGSGSSPISRSSKPNWGANACNVAT